MNKITVLKPNHDPNFWKNHNRMAALNEVITPITWVTAEAVEELTNAMSVVITDEEIEAHIIVLCDKLANEFNIYGEYWDGYREGSKEALKYILSRINPENK